MGGGLRFDLDPRQEGACMETFEPQWLVHESSSEYACMGRTHLMHVAYARVWRRLSKAANDFIQCELIRIEADV